MAVIMVLILGGMVIPIVGILLALLFDAFALVWYAYREWHDDWSGRLAERVRAQRQAPSLRPIAH